MSVKIRPRSMKLLCKLGMHDFKLATAFIHTVEGGYYLGFGYLDDYDQVGAQGYECRSCGRRKIEKTGISGLCAVGTWQKAIDWLSEEEIKC